MNRMELENCMERYGNDLLSFCRYLTKNKEEAEDLCQDTFVKGYELSERIGSGVQTKQFFLSIAVRLWKNRKRQYAWRRRIIEERVIPEAVFEMDAAESEGTPEQEAILEETRAVIRECVDSLPEKMRLTVLLYYMEELKEKEIAEVLGLPEGTVKSRLHRAKTMLSEKLSGRL